MVDKEMLQAMAQLLTPINERLDKMESSVGERLDRIETSVAEIREDTRHTRVLIEATNKNLKLSCEAQQETFAKFKQLDRMEMTLNDVKSDTEVIKDVVRWHSGDIKNLKKAL